MKISIVSSFYNDKKMLKLVMNSVIEQTFQHIEHIIVDAASTDGSVEIIKEYEKRYVRSGKMLKWISEPDKGLYFGWNKAFALASGDYIILASDPYVDKDVFKDISLILEEKNPDYIYGGMIFQKDGEIIRRWSGNSGNWRFGWMAATPTLCVKKTVFDGIGMWDVNNISADYKFQIKLFMDKNLKSYAVNRVMVLYYAGGTSNGGIKAKWNSMIGCQKALTECGVRFAWFTNFCKTSRALLSYIFVLHKKIDLPFDD